MLARHMTTILLAAALVNEGLSSKTAVPPPEHPEITVTEPSTNGTVTTTDIVDNKAKPDNNLETSTANSTDATTLTTEVNDILGPNDKTEIPKIPTVVSDNDSKTSDSHTNVEHTTSLPDGNGTSKVEAKVTDHPEKVTESQIEVTNTHSEGTDIIPVTNANERHTSKDSDVTGIPAIEITDADKVTDDSVTRVPNYTAVNNGTLTTPGTTSKIRPNRQWMDIFLNLHHFDGWYTYGGAKNLFDFVVLYVHPNSVNTLVANFYDEAGGVLEMNGVSLDGVHVTFTLSKLYTATYRFPSNQRFEIVGILLNTKTGYVYKGNITRPKDSPFEIFSMTEGRGPSTSSDSLGTKMALIIAIPSAVGFLAVVGTTSLICWAAKKGYLRRKHKSYRLFSNSTVAYESVAETVHI